MDKLELCDSIPMSLVTTWGDKTMTTKQVDKFIKLGMAISVVSKTFGEQCELLPIRRDRRNLCAKYTYNGKDQEGIFNYSDLELSNGVN